MEYGVIAGLVSVASVGMVSQLGLEVSETLQKSSFSVSNNLDERSVTLPSGAIWKGRGCDISDPVYGSSYDDYDVPPPGVTCFEWNTGAPYDAIWGYDNNENNSYLFFIKNDQFEFNSTGGQAHRFVYEPTGGLFIQSPGPNNQIYFKGVNESDVTFMAFGAELYVYGIPGVTEDVYMYYTAQEGSAFSALHFEDVTLTPRQAAAKHQASEEAKVSGDVYLSAFGEVYNIMNRPHKVSASHGDDTLVYNGGVVSVDLGQGDDTIDISIYNRADASFTSDGMFGYHINLPSGDRITNLQPDNNDALIFGDQTVTGGSVYPI